MSANKHDKSTWTLCHNLERLSSDERTRYMSELTREELTNVLHLAFEKPQRAYENTEREPSPENIEQAAEVKVENEYPECEPPANGSGEDVDLEGFESLRQEIEEAKEHLRHEKAERRRQTHAQEQEQRAKKNKILGYVKGSDCTILIKLLVPEGTQEVIHDFSELPRDVRRVLTSRLDRLWEIHTSSKKKKVVCAFGHRLFSYRREPGCIITRPVTDQWRTLGYSHICRANSTAEEQQLHDAFSKEDLPCACVRMQEGSAFLCFMPLPEEDRVGKTWDELDFWVKPCPV